MLTNWTITKADYQETITGTLNGEQVSIQVFSLIGGDGNPATVAGRNVQTRELVRVRIAPQAEGF